MSVSFGQCSETQCFEVARHAAWSFRMCFDFSGSANLSDDYFTNRQDRYVVIRDASLANFCSNLTDMVAKWSYQADPDCIGQFSPPATFRSSVEDDGKAFATAFSKALENIMQANTEGRSSPEIDEDVELDDEAFFRAKSSSNAPSSHDGIQADTWVFPFSQFGYGNVREEEGLLGDLLGPHLTDWRHEAQLTLATGYMNLPSEYVDLLLKSPCEVGLVTASPPVRFRVNMMCVVLSSRFTVHFFLKI